MLRFAPSPTGDMHIGNLRIAIFNYVLAKQQNKQFIVRIEDLDVEKNIEGKDGEILAILEKFGFKEDQLYYQSKNKHIHQHMALKLVEQKKAFACFCSDEEIAAQKHLAKNEKREYRYSGKCEFLTQKEILKSDKKYVVRLKKPQSDICFESAVTGNIKATPNEVDSFVILRSDGSPTDNFASAIDDMIHGITYVCKDDASVGDTPKQIHVRNMLDYEKSIRYAHLPAILNAEALSVKELLSEGFLPDAIINYLLLLGNQTPCEIFDIHEAITWFDINNVSKTAQTFNLDKLRFLNRAHINKIDSRELSKYFGFSEASIGDLAKLYTEEASTLKEIDSKITAIFRPKNFENESKTQMISLQNTILKAPFFDEYDTFVAHVMNASGLKENEFTKVLRLLLTGCEKGPDLSLIYPHIKGYITQIVR
jgi:glutamyl-tRNA synthetase